MARNKDAEWYFSQTRRIAEHREAGAEKAIRKHYKELLKDLQSFLGEQYANLAEDDALTYAILQQKGDAARFLEEVEQHINTLTPKAAQEIRDVVEETYTLAYEGLVNAVEKSADLEALRINLDGLRSTTPEIVKRAVQNPISGLTLNDTLEKNRKEVIYEIKRQIGVGLTTGDRYSTMARRISDQLNMSYTKAVRIVRTETHRVREAGSLDGALAIQERLNEADSEFRLVKVWKTMQDERVRPQRRYKTKSGWKTSKRRGGPDHMKMDGQTVLVDEPFDLGGGVTAMAPGSSGVAGQDINCRCIKVEKLMDDAEFFAATGRHFRVENSGNSGILEVPTTSTDEHYTQLLDGLYAQAVEYNPVANHASVLSQGEIIQALGGGDQTSGSCASLGLAYIGQTKGWNVLDFRGGESCNFFSMKSNLRAMTELPGVKTLKEVARSSVTAGNRLLSRVEAGKEYYLCSGRHAAIVRKTNDGVLQYLELQTQANNGWMNFNGNPRYTLKTRFGENKGYDVEDFMVDLAESDFETDEFRSLLGFLNTASDKQKKGRGGYAK